MRVTLRQLQARQCSPTRAPVLRSRHHHHNPASYLIVLKPRHFGDHGNVPTRYLHTKKYRYLLYDSTSLCTSTSTRNRRTRVNNRSVNTVKLPNLNTITIRHVSYRWVSNNPSNYRFPPLQTPGTRPCVPIQTTAQPAGKRSQDTVAMHNA